MSVLARPWARLRAALLRPRSTTLLHIAEPTRDQLAALASVIDDMSNPRSSPRDGGDIWSGTFSSGPRT